MESVPGVGKEIWLKLSCFPRKMSLIVIRRRYDIFSYIWQIRRRHQLRRRRS